MQGTEISPGPSLLENFPKQGLAQEATMEDGQDKTSSPSRKMLEKNQDQASKQQDMHMEMYISPSAALEIKDTDNQADSQPTRRFLTRTE